MFQLTRRRGVSLLELLAVVTIVGLLAGLIFARFISSSDAAAKNACYVNRGEIELQAQLWFRDKAVWPQANLSDIDLSFFPEGLPTCPVDGSPYQFDSATGKVIGHVH